MGINCSNANNQLPCCSTGGDDERMKAPQTYGLPRGITQNTTEEERKTYLECRQQNHNWLEYQSDVSSALPSTTPNRQTEGSQRKSYVLHYSSGEENETPKYRDCSTHDGQSVSKFESIIRHTENIRVNEFDLVDGKLTHYLSNFMRMKTLLTSFIYQTPPKSRGKVSTKVIGR